MVLKATNKQFNILNGYTNGASKLAFQLDGNNNYIIGKQVLFDDAFIEVRGKLQDLEEVEYVPPIINE